MTREEIKNNFLSIANQVVANLSKYQYNECINRINLFFTKVDQYGEFASKIIATLNQYEFGTDGVVCRVSDKQLDWIVDCAYNYQIDFDGTIPQTPLWQKLRDCLENVYNGFISHNNSNISSELARSSAITIEKYFNLQRPAVLALAYIYHCGGLEKSVSLETFFQDRQSVKEAVLSQMKQSDCFQNDGDVYRLSETAVRLLTPNS